MERKKNVAEIKKLLLARKEGMHSFSILVRFLISKGIAHSIAEEIALEMAQNGNQISGLNEILAKKIHTAKEIDFEENQTTYLALVGPTGVGKSTTLMKIADFYLQKGKKIGIFNLDTEKKGSFEKYAALRNVPLFHNFNEIQGLVDIDLILIDTPGCNFYQPNRVDEIGEILAEFAHISQKERAENSMETLLTLSAATKDVDIYGAVHQFSPLDPTGLIFTKLDETLAAGILINISSKTNYPIRYITYGYPLPGEFQIADPYKITHRILVDMNQEEFQNLRQLSVYYE